MLNSKDCRVCRLIRFYLLLAFPLIVIMGIGSLDTEANLGASRWIAPVELIDYLAWGAASAVVLIVAYRGYIEFWIPKRQKSVLARLLESDEVSQEKD